jgi:hypothetical protein
MLADEGLAQDQIDQMLRDGVDREPDGRLVTSNAILASKYKMAPDEG